MSKKIIKKTLFAASRAVLYVAVLIVFFCGFGLLVSHSSASADVNSLMAKWQNAMYYDCQSKFATSVQAAGDSDLVISSVLGGNVSAVEHLPSYDYSGQGSTLTCSNVVGGKVSGLSGTTWKDIINAENVLKNMGYTVTNGDRNFTINAHVVVETCTNDWFASTTECSKSQGETESATITARYDSSDGLYHYQLLHPWVGNAFKSIKIKFDSDKHTMIISDSEGIHSYSETLVNDPSVFLSNLKKSSLINANWKVPGRTETDQMSYEKTTTYWYTFTFSDLVKTGSASYKFDMADRYKYANKFSSPSLNNSEMTVTERYNLYMYYLTHAITAYKGFVSNPDNKTGLTEVKYRKSDGTSGTCYANLNGTKTDTLYTLNMAGSGSNRYPYIATVALSGVVNGVVEWLNAVDISKLDSDAGVYCDEAEPTPPDDGDDDGSGSTWDAEDDFCDDMEDRITGGEGVGAMQWVLCPGLDNATYTANWIDKKVEEWLEVNPDWYRPGDSPVYNVWNNVRGIANVLMILFLLIIIVSQVTGYGIDNYGIKKMLPKLIVMAIVINLSFYICALAVDFSNILGSGLRDMFGYIGNISTGNLSGSTDTNFIQDSVVALFAAASTAGGAPLAAGMGAISVAGVGIGVAILIAALVLVLVIIVAVVILWVMIGLRMVIVLTCILISPLAFACYILPNTQNLTKKWWELFKAALIIFPLCGAVSGISHIFKDIAEVQKLDVGMRVVITILPYLGFFMLPLLLKNAIAALGKIGGTLTAMGQSFKSGGKALGQGAMKLGMNSETAKRMQEQAAKRRQLRWANNYTRRHGDGEAIKDRIAAAKERVKNAAPNSFEGRRARNELDRLQRQAMLVDEASKIQNRTNLEQEYANQGGTHIWDTETTVPARAESMRGNEIFKDQFDYYSAPERTTSEMNTAFASAISDYKANKNDVTEAKVRAMIAALDKRGMNKEMLNNLNDFGLSAQNKHDARILAQMAGTGNDIIAQAGKDISKKSGALSSTASYTPTTLAQYISGTSSLSGLSAKEAMAPKGPNAGATLDDDTYEYLKTHGGEEVYDYEQLVNTALNSKDGKQLAQVNDLIARNAQNTNGYKIKLEQLGKINHGTILGMDQSVYADAVNDLVRLQNTDVGRQIMSNMDPQVKDFLRGRGLIP